MSPWSITRPDCDRSAVRLDSTPSSEPSASQPFLAISLICVSTLFFSAMGACAKWLAADLPVVQIIWGRYFFHALLIVVLFPRRAPSLLASGRKDLQVLRSVLVLGATVCAFTALRYLPLASVAALGFVGPLLVLGLATVFLGERVGLARWIAVATGFVGVLVILRPGLGVMHWASLLPLMMAACYATYQVLTRVIRGLAPPLTSLFYTALVGTVAASCVVPFYWVPLSPGQWAGMIGAGFFGGAGHLAVIKAYESAHASRVAPFVYSELVWAIAIGWAVFAQLPDLWTLAGSALLVATGLYLLNPRTR